MFEDETEDTLLPGGSLEPLGERTSEPGVINFYFPVEVVVVGALRDADRELIEARMWENLYDAIERTT